MKATQKNDCNFYKTKLNRLIQDHIVDRIDTIMSDIRTMDFSMFLDYLDKEEKLEIAAAYMLSMNPIDQLEFLTGPKNSHLFPFFIGTAMINLKNQTAKQHSDATTTAINYIGNEIYDYCEESLEELFAMTYDDYAYQYREMKMAENTDPMNGHYL